MNWYKKSKNRLAINIYVVPRSSKSEIIGIYNDSLKIKLKSPPVDNAANEELIRFLADKLKIPKKNIEITKGRNQKKKIISIEQYGLNALQWLHANI
ncbi:MAG: YggU family protein [Candidatus Melainabacteria bacterium RIFCSPLOWO2_02_FULL_35_15]|nr:MAG: YggU family protein [Candidatus Melainabacteria bacterium RIFCSPLOWO2_12_FULL_35_11]OGI13921.1 MAG: YggU family protein [Candidatus Melainabacteria bacterium RIFCSPLOWO2_02_FULL_35_15]